MKSIPLEDFYCDIIGKAQRGLDLDGATLCEQAGITREELREAKKDVCKVDVVRKLAKVLALGADALVACAEKSWFPREVGGIGGFEGFTSEFKEAEMLVNAYIVWDPATMEAALFDTGCDASLLLEFVESKELNVKRIYVTHTHYDHIAVLKEITAKHDVEIVVGAKEIDKVPGAVGVEEGWESNIGSLKIQAFDTFGHAVGGITYLVTGLSKPIAIVGDALFAGSMGGGAVSYSDALRTSGGAIISMDESTVVACGHGPLSTVGEERSANPFFAK